MNLYFGLGFISGASLTLVAEFYLLFFCFFLFFSLFKSRLSLLTPFRLGYPFHSSSTFVSFSSVQLRDISVF
jgi:hypothetical protein